MMTAPISNYFDDGMVFFESGEYEQAIDLFTRALRLSLGDLAETLLYRGICYAYLEAYDRAMNDFNDALRRDPYMPDLYNERGNLYRLDGDFQRAIEDYTAAIAIDESHYAAYYNRALAYENLNQLDEAVADLTRSIDIKPDTVACYEARGRIHTNLRQYARAISDYDMFLQLGGGYEYDNRSDVQSLIITLRINQFLSRFIPPRFLPDARL